MFNNPVLKTKTGDRGTESMILTAHATDLTSPVRVLPLTNITLICKARSANVPANAAPRRWPLSFQNVTSNVNWTIKSRMRVIPTITAAALLNMYIKIIRLNLC